MKVIIYGEYLRTRVPFMIVVISGANYALVRGSASHATPRRHNRLPY